MISCMFGDRERNFNRHYRRLVCRKNGNGKEVKAVHVGGEGTLIKYITEQHRRNRKYIMTRKGERENEKLIYFTGKDKKL